MIKEELLNAEELEIYNKLDSDKKKIIEEKLQAIDDNFKVLVERAKQFDIIHEDVVVIEKLDIASIRSTRIYTAPQQADTRIRMSYYGRILSIAHLHQADELQEEKKKNLKVGDIVTFNPEAAYSLNVLIPKNEPSIWILGINAIIARDNAFNMEQCLKKMAICEVIYEEERKEKIMPVTSGATNQIHRIVPGIGLVPNFRPK